MDRLRSLSLLLFPLSLVASAACSEPLDAPEPEGETAGTPDAGTGAPPVEEIDCPDFGALPVDPTLVLDDLEDGDYSIVQASNRNGSWWLSMDEAGMGTVVPTGNTFLTPERILGGRCGSQYAVRITGEWQGEWGPNISLSFRYDSVLADIGGIDATRFRGVAFWARVGEQHRSSVRVQVQDGNTYPSGGVCTPDGVDLSQCYNAYGTQLVPLAAEWRYYQIPFTGLGQQDFGVRTDALALDNVFALEWILTTNTVFDLWIDDVSFYE